MFLGLVSIIYVLEMDTLSIYVRVSMWRACIPLFSLWFRESLGMFKVKIFTPASNTRHLVKAMVLITNNCPADS